MMLIMFQVDSKKLLLGWQSEREYRFQRFQMKRAK